MKLRRIYITSLSLSLFLSSRKNRYFTCLAFYNTFERILLFWGNNELYFKLYCAWILREFFHARNKKKFFTRYLYLYRFLRELSAALFPFTPCLRRTRWALTRERLFYKVDGHRAWLSEPDADSRRDAFHDEIQSC